jgi:hypothetical protein
VPGETNAFLELLRDVQELHNQVGHTLDNLDDLKVKLRKLAKQGSVFPDLELSTPVPPEDLEIRVDESPATPPPIVKFVMLERQLDGTFLMQIGEKGPVRIPKSLALLLAAMACGSGEYVIEKDPFVGWKSWQSLASKLGLSNRHAVSGRIYRLRKLLKRHALDAHLVQTSSVIGARFGLSRKGSLVIEDDAK